MTFRWTPPIPTPRLVRLGSGTGTGDSPRNPLLPDPKRLSQRPDGEATGDLNPPSAQIVEGADGQTDAGGELLPPGRNPARS